MRRRALKALLSKVYYAGCIWREVNKCIWLYILFIILQIKPNTAILILKVFKYCNPVIQTLKTLCGVLSFSVNCGSHSSMSRAAPF